MVNAVFQAVDYDISIHLTAKNIYPSDHLTSDKVKPLLILNLITVPQAVYFDMKFTLCSLQTNKYIQA